MAFWASDYQNFYEASIFPNGTFAVFRMVSNEWAPVVGRTMSDAIKKGIGAVNELQVVLIGANASFYINGTKVSDFLGQPPPDGGATGLYAASGVDQQNDWRFINITVVENQ